MIKKLLSRKPIIIVPGQLNSIFFEIFFKTLKNKNILSPLLLICNKKDFVKNAKKNKYTGKIQSIKNLSNIEKKMINIIDIKIKISKKKHLQKIYNNQYLEDCFNTAFKIIKKKLSYKLLNGPINKNIFLKNKYLGITEYISEYFSTNKVGMLIYNKKLSVCPLTTHLPIKFVTKSITKKMIEDRLKIINNFYLNKFKFKPKIGVTGLNPHCESISSFNEDKKVIAPAIKSSKKKGISVLGPYPADTIFLKQNRNKFDVILGMYHDQVLTPLKTLYEYDAINVTMGLPFLRVSPDHGPNEKMVNKNLSNPTSLFKALEFLDQN